MDLPGLILCRLILPSAYRRWFTVLACRQIRSLTHGSVDLRTCSPRECLGAACRVIDMDCPEEPGAQHYHLFTLEAVGFEV